MKDAMYQGKRYRVLDEGKDFLVLQSGVGTPLAVKRADVTEAPEEKWEMVKVEVDGSGTAIWHPDLVRGMFHVADLSDGYRAVLVDIQGMNAVSFERKVSG